MPTPLPGIKSLNHAHPRPDGSDVLMTSSSLRSLTGLVITARATCATSSETREGQAEERCAPVPSETSM
jgi:hypothetical protein